MEGSRKTETSLTSQSAWILLAKVVGFALNILLPLLVVRYLSQDQVGVYRQSFLVAANAVLILPLGFSMSAYYFLNRDTEKRPHSILNILLFNFGAGGLAFLVLFFYPQLLGALFQNPQMEALSPLIGLLIWLWIFSSFLETAALANQEAKLAAFFIVLAQLTKLLLMAGSLLAFGTVRAFLYAAIFQAALQTVVLLIYLHRRFPGFWTSFDRGFFWEQIVYAMPYGLSVLLYIGQTDLHNYFVSHSFSAAEFAIYSQGCFQLPLVTMLYESVASVMIPRVSQLQSEDKKREILTMTVSATQKLAFVYFPLFVFLMIAADVFITTLFTNEYAASAAIFRVNLFALPLFALVVDPIARAYPEAGRFLLKFRIALCIALFAILWLGLGKFGLLSMITIVVASILVEKIACAWISVRMLDITLKDISLLKTIGRIAVAAFVSGVVLGVLYIPAHEPLLRFAVDTSRRILSAVGFEKGADFFGGAAFLGVCFGLYAVIYLAIASVIGAVEAEDRAKFADKLKGLKRRFFGGGRLARAAGEG